MKQAANDQPKRVWEEPFMGYVGVRHRCGHVVCYCLGHTAYAMRRARGMAGHDCRQCRKAKAVVAA